MSSSFEFDLSNAVSHTDIELVTKLLDVHEKLLAQDTRNLCSESHLQAARQLVKCSDVADMNKSEATSNKEVSKRGRKKQKRVEEDSDDKLEKDDNEWVCAICNQLKSEDNSDLVLCDGDCLRSFHSGCLGLAVVPEGEWKCTACVENNHSCFICQEEGSDGDVSQYYVLLMMY